MYRLPLLSTAKDRGDDSEELVAAVPSALDPIAIMPVPAKVVMVPVAFVTRRTL